MPSGFRHNVATTVATMPAGVATYLATEDITVTGLVVAGMLATFLLSCDLDVDAGNISVAILRKRSRFLGWVWRYFWLPYGKLFKHRGLSHTPIFGTLTRLVYFFPAWPLWAWLWPHTSWVWVGIILADTLHWALDKLDHALGGRL